MPKFKLPTKSEGRVVVADRYVFVNGEMPVSKGDAMKLERILCRFHGCTISYDDDVVIDKGVAEDSSLAVDVTKTGAATKPAAEAKSAAEVKPAATEKAKA